MLVGQSVPFVASSVQQPFVSQRPLSQPFDCRVSSCPMSNGANSNRSVMTACRTVGHPAAPAAWDRESLPAAPSGTEMPAPFEAKRIIDIRYVTVQRLVDE
jgi:hypothetical protein